MSGYISKNTNNSDVDEPIPPQPPNCQTSQLTSSSPVSSQPEAPSPPLFEGVSQHASALALAIKQNVQEVSKLESVFQDLERQRLNEKEDLDKVRGECQRLMGELYALESESNSCKEKIKYLKKEIARALWEKHLVKVRITQKENEFKILKKTLAEYDSKMEDVRKKTADIEAQTEAEIQLSRLRQEVDDTRAQKTEMEKKMQIMMTLPNGDAMTEMDLKKDIEGLHQRIEECKAVHETKRREVDQCKQDSVKLETANQILLKKNCALLTRLKRKAIDQHENYKAWKGRTEFLQHQIDVTKEKLQKFH